MADLEELRSGLLEELGDPPAEWAEQQRRRLREAGAFEARHARRGLQAVAGVALAVVCVASWLWIANGAESAPASDVDRHVWLSSETLNEPYQTEDGSTIALDEGARGRLASDPTSTRFDLHQGRGVFEVQHRPGRKWTVIAGQYDVHVVGTRFSVLYTPPGALEVSVQRGIVAVQVPWRAAAIELQAGERLSADGERFVLEHADERLPARETPSTTSPEVATSAAAEPSAAASPPLASVPSPGKPGWRELYRQGKYRAAFAQARRSGFEDLLRTLDLGALHDLASTARLAGETSAALQALTTLERRFPSSTEAADAGFLIGRIRAAQGQSDQAIARFEAYLKRGDRARYSLEATGRLIELYAAQGNERRARALAERYLKQAPHGPYRRLAQAVLQRP